jgi:hypothetical protein
MTPERRLDRVERILGTLATSGRKARSEFREKIYILIHAQMETDDLIKGLAVGQARVNQELAELAKSQRLTDQALRAFINSHRKRENGDS